MSHRFDTAYRFASDDQWRAGARQNLMSAGGQLLVPDQQCLNYLDGAGPEDRAALPGVDACGRLTWLRPRQLQLVRRYSFGIEEIGVLSGTSPVRQLAIGTAVIWLLTQHGLQRYAANSLQLLGDVEHPPGWTTADIGSDAGDGVWAVDVDADGRGRLRHVDCWARTCCDPIELDEPVGLSPRLATSGDGDRVVVLSHGDPPTLIVVDVTGRHPARRLPLEDPSDPKATTGFPVAFDVDEHDRVRLLWPVAGDAPAVILEAVAFSGEVESSQRLELPPRFGNVTGLMGALVVGTGGLALLGSCDGEQGETRTSTFVTPALVSPVGVKAGWNRAEVDIVLPPGTSMEITWAATSDRALIQRVDELFESGGRATGRLVQRLESLLPWRDDRRVRYEGSVPANGEETALAALLDEVDDPTLWLRVELRTPPGRSSPRLSGLRVLYPSDSYLDDLPAVYREDERSAAQLRKVLAPFEVLFDGLDDVLESLPRRIDPNTATDDWTAFLLSWLGFPALGDLAPSLRRALLHRAAELLGRRGTIGALEAVLDIVTGGRAHVEDSADGPAAWFLPSDDAPAPARLGIDTLVAAQQPPPARPGGLLLRQTPLGNGCVDPELVLASRARLVTVRLDIGPDERTVLEPIVERLLRVFVPAHCRLRVIYSGIDGRLRTRQLDVDFRLGPEDEGSDVGGWDDTAEEETPDDVSLDGLLYSDAHWQLGANTHLGRWELPDPPCKPAILDHTGFDRTRRLS
jgi:phage tail-like protein